MSNDAVTAFKASPDYTAPIARAGEQQFAAIVRNRSGIGAGEIDFGARSINDLCDGDQQDAVDAVFMVYLKWCEETGKRAAQHLRDRQS